MANKLALVKKTHWP